ncbi:MAG: hypothetical protein J5870_01955, partial [Clostridia bacterium]|nr:hypothetical protein [Clostridia bacterium]
MGKISKTVSIILCIVIMLGIAPLNGFVGLKLPKLNFPKIDSSKITDLFVTKAEAEEVFVEGYCGDISNGADGHNLSYVLDSN